jgi:hypothetical protein
MNLPLDLQGGNGVTPFKRETQEKKRSRGKGIPELR